MAILYCKAGTRLIEVTFQQEWREALGFPGLNQSRKRKPVHRACVEATKSAESSQGPVRLEQRKHAENEARDLGHCRSQF